MAIVIAALVYVFLDIDFANVGKVLSGYRLEYVGLSLVALFLALVPTAQRLRFIADGQLAFGMAYQAIVLALGLNFVLPAKLGEVAKAVYIQRVGKVSMAQGFNAVFWERFFDVQALLILMIGSAWSFGKMPVIWPLAAIVAGIWVSLLVHFRWPGFTHSMVRLVPTARLRGLARDILACVSACRDWRFLSMLGVYTLLCWLMYPVVFILIIQGAADMGLSVGCVLFVFAVSAFGMALPSSPGSLGVFEATMLLSLGWFGIDRDSALAAALVLRAVQFVPLVIGSALVCVTSDIRFSSLRTTVGTRES